MTQRPVEPILGRNPQLSWRRVRSRDLGDTLWALFELRRHELPGMKLRSWVRRTNCGRNAGWTLRESRIFM